MSIITITKTCKSGQNEVTNLIINDCHDRNVNNFKTSRYCRNKAESIIHVPTRGIRQPNMEIRTKTKQK